MLESIPAKPAIFTFALASGALAFTAHLAERGVESAQRAQQAASTGEPQALQQILKMTGNEEAAASLEMLMSQQAGLPGFDLGATGQSVLGEGAAEPELDPNSSEAVRARRPEGWVYPEWEKPAVGLHGAAATPTPRNLRLALVGEVGEAFEPSSLAAVQNGPDGRHELHGYSAHGAEGAWILGTPALSTGSAASFEVRAMRDGEAWVGEFDLASVPADIDICVGLPVEMRPAGGR